MSGAPEVTFVIVGGSATHTPAAPYAPPVAFVRKTV